ncbi:uncharacterized protein LOC131555447 [Ammospiza caudacuta]|uniref:uncharacterized protein LOC131555447 n=1 Tax=Ammospiza caudacuta TaxID=2857398 RepID=UPI0027382F81|nr:uncharacterized protein LOC131555447 [Ammospiza caudacuta]
MKLPQSSLNEQQKQKAFRKPRCWNAFAHRRLRKGTARSHNTKNAKELRSRGGSGHIAGTAPSRAPPATPSPAEAGARRARSGKGKKLKKTTKIFTNGSATGGARRVTGDAGAGASLPAAAARSSRTPRPLPELRGRKGGTTPAPRPGAAGARVGRGLRAPPACLPGAHPGRCPPGAGEAAAGRTRHTADAHVPAAQRDPPPAGSGTALPAAGAHRNKRKTAPEPPAAPHSARPIPPHLPHSPRRGSGGGAGGGPSRPRAPSLPLPVPLPPSLPALPAPSLTAPGAAAAAAGPGFPAT